MNTLLSYMYRDAANYKFYKDVIIFGTLARDDIRPYLYDAELFIPSAVGLNNLQPKITSELDHIWHEISDITPVDNNSLKPNIRADKLIADFKKASRANWYLDSSKYK